MHTTTRGGKLLSLVLLTGALAQAGEPKRATLTPEKSTVLAKFRNLLGDSGAKLEVSQQCVWVVGAAAAPDSSCRGVTVKWDELSIDGWICDGMAVMRVPNMVSANYDSGKLTSPDKKTAGAPAMLKVENDGDNALAVFKNINAQKSQFKMLIWPLNCVDNDPSTFERDRPAPR